MRIIAGFVLLWVISGCASVQWVDRSRLNHPAMVLTDDRTPAKSSFLTNLDSIQSQAAGGGCTTCAH